jgi:hypothetical protein
MKYSIHDHASWHFEEMQIDGKDIPNFLQITDRFSKCCLRTNASTWNGINKRILRQDSESGKTPLSRVLTNQSCKHMEQFQNFYTELTSQSCKHKIFIASSGVLNFWDFHTLTILLVSVNRNPTPCNLKGKIINFWKHRAYPQQYDVTTFN